MIKIGVGTAYLETIFSTNLAPNPVKVVLLPKSTKDVDKISAEQSNHQSESLFRGRILFIFIKAMDFIFN